MHDDRVMELYREQNHKVDYDAFCSEAAKGSRIMTAEGDNPFCGDMLRIAVLLDDGAGGDAGAETVIRTIGYDGYGCSLCMASAEALAIMVEGKPLSTVRSIAFDDIATALDCGEIPRSRRRCVDLSVEVLQRVLKISTEA